MWSFLQSALPYFDKYGPWFIFSCILCFGYYMAHMRERRKTGERADSFVDIIRSNAESNGKLAIAIERQTEAIHSFSSVQRDTAQAMANGIERMGETMHNLELRNAEKMADILREVSRRG